MQLPSAATAAETGHGLHRRSVCSGSGFPTSRPQTGTPGAQQFETTELSKSAVTKAICKRTTSKDMDSGNASDSSHANSKVPCIPWTCEQIGGSSNVRSLLSGCFNEGASAASFQAALHDWHAAESTVQSAIAVQHVPQQKSAQFSATAHIQTEVTTARCCTQLVPEGHKSVDTAAINYLAMMMLAVRKADNTAGTVQAQMRRAPENIAAEQCTVLKQHAHHDRADPSQDIDLAPACPLYGNKIAETAQLPELQSELEMESNPCATGSDGGAQHQPYSEGCCSSFEHFLEQLQLQADQETIRIHTWQ